VVVERVLVHGWPAARVAEAASVSRPTVYKWVRRFLEEGVEGLNDRSPAPHRRPRALSVAEIQQIVAARRGLKQGPHRLGYALGRPRSTVYGCSGATVSGAWITLTGPRLDRSVAMSELLLDFDGVEVASPSFLDELIKVSAGRGISLAAMNVDPRTRDTLKRLARVNPDQRPVELTA
jgi:hypothetical protein